MLQQALCRYFCSYFVYVESGDLIFSNNETDSSELIGVGCPLWIATRGVCRLSSWWELLHSGCADCPVYAYYSTIFVQTVQALGFTAQWLCRLSILWVLLHSGFADLPVYGNFCTVVVQTPFSGNYCTLLVHTVWSVGITAEWMCRLSSQSELLHSVNSVGLTRGAVCWLSS